MSQTQTSRFQNGLIGTYLKKLHIWKHHYIMTGEDLQMIFLGLEKIFVFNFIAFIAEENKIKRILANNITLW